ncbi:MAG TPA: tetratricopeptide repeat protein [Gemmatimonadales bacterium]|nr:tetratricopeptide repeat protein [Gemmatimonadales bacterium]
MATTEIEKLERRYAENPQGLTFAPLAEVHRKNGDILRALELLKSGLELHPNYIPASIVLGRCHWDQGDLAAAESAFSHVLRLDDENVIALKSLAEISERLGRASEAQRWLKRLISIDRSNEEARQHLARLEGAKAEPVAPPAPATIPPAPAQAAEIPPPLKTTKEEPPPLDLTAAIAEPAPSKSEARDQAPSPAPALEFLDTSKPPSRAEPGSPTAGSSPGEEFSTADQPPQVDGLISQEFVPPREGGYHLHPELTQEFGEKADAIEQLEVETAAEVELQSSGASEFRVPNAAEDFKDLMEAARAPELPELTIEPPALTPVQSAPPPPVAQAAPAPPAPTPARASYSVRETRGQSVAAFFQVMLTARPPGSQTGPASSSGTQQDGRIPSQDVAHPAGNSANQTAPPSPAVPAAAPSPDAAVSFDDFFGAPAGGSGASKGSTDAGQDDLDQFQSWLQNLKR